LYSNQGKYFTNHLVDKSQQLSLQKNNIKFIKTGKTKDLKNILIATDGFIDNKIKKTSEFQKFFFDNKPLFNQTGFSDRKTEFRINVLNKITDKDSHHDWPFDDATFISLNRVPKIKSNRI
jgi:hypothetical protein